MSTPVRNDLMGIALAESERTVLRLIFRQHARTQGQLSKATGLTQQSASRIVGQLLGRDLLSESARVATGRRGYPSSSFKLKADAAYAIGVSLMVDAMTMTLVDFSGEVVEEIFQPCIGMSKVTVLDWVATTSVALLEQHVRDPSKMAGLGVAVAGSHIGQGGGYNTPYALEDWAGIDIAEIFSSRLGMPVWSDNNGNLAAFAEAMIGVGKTTGSFAYLHIGSGVGGGVVINGELWRGINGNAGEFAGGLPPNIYPFPNLELLRRIVVSSGVELDSVNDLIDKFDPSWEAIDDWIARVRDSVSIIASNATAILDVDLIVLGGRMPPQLARMLIPRIEFFDQKRRSVARPTARIVAAEATGDAAALGAAILPLQKIYF